MQGEDLPGIIRSRVVGLNLDKEYALFSNFELAGTNIGKRTQIRVEPDDPLIAVTKFKGSAYEFLLPLADISLNGASVWFESYMLPARLSTPGSELSMTISLPDSVSRKIKKTSLKPGKSPLKMTSPLSAGQAAERDGQIIITANGKVVYVQSDKESNRYRMSVQLFFHDLSRMVVLQYISQRQSEIIQDLRLLSEDLYNRK